MTVAKLIEWLKTQNQDAVVHVVFHEAGYGYDVQGGTARTVVFDPSCHSEHYDYSDPVFPENGIVSRTSKLLLGVYEG